MAGKPQKAPPLQKRRVRVVVEIVLADVTLQGAKRFLTAKLWAMKQANECVDSCVIALVHPIAGITREEYVAYIEGKMRR